MINKVIILTEAGKEFGYGHLTRCLSIAQGFSEKGIDSIFFIRGDSSPDKILKEFKWEGVDWFKENIDVSGKIVVIDSYHADENFCEKIYNNSATVLFIDDYNRINYPGGFVLNSVLGAEDIGYPANPEIKYLFGPIYHPLRKEFWDVPVKEIKKNIEKILITFGGSDMTNETPGVLNMLKENYSYLEKHVIIGNGFSNIDDIKDAADEKTFLIYQPDAERMKQEMLECDIAISAAGQTIYELARVGVPSLIKKIADNQENNIKYWEKEKCIERFNTLKDLNIFLKNSMEQRELYNLRMTNVIDGKGVYNILDSIYG
jgi:UDP-2,4-diacetamido-2,4,6-trideoxy-beta-L-altropyranose hydrolase